MSPRARVVDELAEGNGESAVDVVEVVTGAGTGAEEEEEEEEKVAGVADP